MGIAVWRLLKALVHLGLGVWTCLRHFPRLDAQGRREAVRRWCARLMAHLGVRVVTHGAPLQAPVLLVSNHVSWLDIMAIDAVYPARFVSKAEVRRWPVVGWLVAQAGTLFIERSRRRDALRMVHEVSLALSAGDIVAVFPEGTTSCGRGLKPFHANMLQAAIGAGVAVQPVALRYRDAREAVSQAAAYVDDMTLLRSLWQIVRARELTVHVDWLEPLDPQAMSRRDLTDRARDQIAQRLAWHDLQAAVAHDRAGGAAATRPQPGG